MPRPAALITGAGSGIGRAAAILLAREGYDVALVGRRAERLAETAALLPRDARHIEIAADIGRADQARAAIDRCLAAFGRLDALVNNAGYAPMKPIDEHTPALIDEVYRVNALGPAYLIARAWPAFRAQHGQTGVGGCVVNISTQGIDDPYPGFLAYASAKAAASTMARSVAKEGEAIGVRGFAIAPGAVETGMFRAIVPESVVPKTETMTPESVAQVILECLRGDHDVQNGDTIRLKGR
jgi:NAD(P)-dependent dehydrogenase (short-subunit alcohol dehydrogenase family)